MKTWLSLSSVVVICMALLAFTFSRRTISGLVVDEQNNPLAGVTVAVKGSTTATITDEQGKFSLEVENNDVLIVSSVGYNTVNVKVGKKQKLTILLKAQAQNLDEVVVVGYGTQQKQALVGGIALTRRNTAHLPAADMASTTGEVGGFIQPADFDREGYDNIIENDFRQTSDNPLSTFSIDVNGASYSNIRRMLNAGQLPPSGAVRVEEMINYFHYNYPQPTANTPFGIYTQLAVCPWDKNHQLLSIGLQGKKIDADKLPPANLVFLIDVSGSMASPDKLPLVQSSMKMLTDQLREQDRVAIVVYAGNAGLVLPSTEGSDKEGIKEAIDALHAGGYTAGGAGLRLAYKVATDNFIKNGNNRVVLCTDGDFNVGESSDDAMERLIEEKRKSGVYLTVLGYGSGNYQDAKMQKLADKGNGNHAYIDNLNEAKKVLINQFGGTMFTIAKDVKLQIEFNPSLVQGYRLIGYENRMLNKEDFNDDKKDAGELGSGHTVTALYEIIPVGTEAPELKKVDKLKYQQQPTHTVAQADELCTIKFRYKKPDENDSRLLTHVVKNNPFAFDNANTNLKLSASVAQFGMLLRSSEYKGQGGYPLVKKILSDLRYDDENGHVAELKKLVNKAASLQNAKKRTPLAQTEDEDYGSR
ncbi:MAG: von Willebrand factor type A domain-containing protein [Niabella sp.]